MEAITNQTELEEAYKYLNVLNLEALPSKVQVAQMEELEEAIHLYLCDCPLFEMGQDYTLDQIIDALSYGGVDGNDGWSYRYSIPENLDVDSYAEIDYPALETMLLFESETVSCQSVLCFLKISDRFYRLVAKDIDGGDYKCSILGD